MYQNIDLKNIGIKLFAIWWAILVLTGYIGYHSYISKSLSTPYWPIIVALVGYAGYNFLKRKRKKKALTLRGFHLFILFQLAVMMLVGFYCQITETGDGLVSSMVNYSISSITYSLALILILVSCYFNGLTTFKFINLKDKPASKVTYTALGISILTFIGFVLGYFGLFKNIILWPIILIFLAIQPKSVLQLFKTIFIDPFPISRENWSTLPMMCIILIVSALHWIASLKVFPVGFDGSTLYMNNANLLAETFTLPSGGHAYNWSIFMGVGTSLFNSATVGMLIAHMAGFMALYAFFLLIRKWLPLHLALLSIVIVLVSPYWSFLASFDEKIDLGFLFIALSVLHMFYQTTSESLERNSKRWYYFLVMGWLLGFCFGIKYTGMILVIAMISQFFHHHLGIKGYWLALLSLFGLSFIGGLGTFGYIEITGSQSLYLGLTLMIAGVLIFFLKPRKKSIKELLPALKTSLLIMIGFGISFLPWSIKHQIEGGTKSINILEGRSDLDFGYQPASGPIKINRSPKDYYVEQKLSVIPVSFQEEKDNNKIDLIDRSGWDEIVRYLGYEEPLWNYLSLPFDFTYNVNITKTKALDVGFLYLILCPFIFIIFLIKKKAVKIMTSVLLLVFSGIGLFEHHYLSSSNSFWNSFEGHASWISGHTEFLNSILNSIYSILLTPISLLSIIVEPLYKMGSSINILFTLLVVTGLFYGLSTFLKRKIVNWNKDAISLGMIVATFTLFWTITGNGIIWYGLLIWVALPALVIYQIMNLKRDLPFSHIWSFSIIGVFIFINLFLLFTNDSGGQAVHEIFQEPFVKHFTSPTSTEDQVLSSYNIDSYKAIQLINAEPDKKIYMVNTSFLYHIDRNDIRIISDSKLQQFGKQVVLFKENEYFLYRLRQKNVGFILLDLNTPSLDRTEEKLLVDRFDKFTQVLNRNNRLKLIASDNYIADENASVITTMDGRKIKARQGLKGKTVIRGSFVLYQVN